MLRREPHAILAAHRMDSARRELYVEGSTDQAFLEWLIGPRLARNSRVISIDFVDLPEVREGGNRARLLRFLEIVDGADADIRGLVDADNDRLAGNGSDVGKNAWLTDFRDAEGYVLTVHNIDTMLRAGCGLLHPAADTVYPSMVAAARPIAAMRLVAGRRGYALPFKNGPWHRHIRCAGGTCVSVDTKAIATGLLQAADVSLAEVKGFLGEVEEAESALSAIPDLEVIHGKDSLKILTKQLASAGVTVDDAGRMVRSTFARDRLHEYPVLAAVVEYLAGA